MNAATTARPSRRTLVAFLVIALGWAAVVGAGLHLTGTPLDSVTGIAVLALLYMPSPLVAALLAERGVRWSRVRLPGRRLRPILVFLLAPVVLVLGAVGLHLLAVLLGGNVLGLSGVGTLATSSAAILEGATRLLGAEAVAAAGPPPPLGLILLGGAWAAVLAGWTVNGLVALGEEYGWRGLMWEALEPLGIVRANVLIGLAWGLWHAPLVLQGYNFPDPLTGVPAMVLFCIALSFLLSAIREATGSVLPVAAAHGIFNALAPMVLLVTPGTSPVLAGPLGLLGAVLLLGVGAAAWRVLRRRRPGRAVGTGRGRRRSGVA